MADFTNEIKKRRTFAIISHPDAGKTTLTEKFLLYGGAINQAGSVKGKATAKHAVSDWMEIEKERGISVTSSVLQFNYGGYCINILDTPGHQDFSEDTYRTLMAADSAVMVIDASKGVEAQTRKLFKVCVMRHIPIFTFINKLDREAKDTFELLDDIEKELGIATCPINWPIGSGKEFKGVYDRAKREVELFSDTKKGTAMGEVKMIPIDAPETEELIGADAKDILADEIELLDGAAAEFDQELVDKGQLSPVFFGSALTNFGVETFLKHFLKMTTSPLPRKSDHGEIDPMTEKDFSAFVFKIQANMNKAHRDRIAFMRICSGEFEAGMSVYHVQLFAGLKVDGVDDAVGVDVLAVYMGADQHLAAVKVLRQPPRGFVGLPGIDRRAFWEALHHVIEHHAAVLVVEQFRVQEIVVDALRLAIDAADERHAIPCGFLFLHDVKHHAAHGGAGLCAPLVVHKMYDGHTAHRPSMTARNAALTADSSPAAFSRAMTCTLPMLARTVSRLMLLPMPLSWRSSSFCSSMTTIRLPRQQAVT